MKRRAAPKFTRRTAVTAGAIALPLIACGSETSETEGSGGGSSTSAGNAGGGTTTGSASGGGGAAAGTGGSTATGAGGSPDGWATGGTASMTDKATYPDPFTGSLGNSCPIIASTTLGPCYAMTIDREDVSEGQTGLPVRLALLVVDGQCQPIANAEVDIWHTNIEGFYSGDDAVALCTLDDPEAEASRWFRGVQTTNAEGKVFFDTCFPGWYGGRAIHIHFQVRIGNQQYKTSQLFFAQSLIDEVFTDHPEYSPFGAPDTPNGNDGIYFADGELETDRMSDGAMLAWKVLSVPA